MPQNKFDGGQIMRSRDLGMGDALAEISTTVYSCHRGGVVALCHTVKQHFVSLEIAGTLTNCGRVTQICVFNTVKLGTSASSP